MAEPTPSLVLASASGIRRQILFNAGLSPIVDPADLDEVAAIAPLANRTVPERARALAEAKALHVGSRHPGAVTIGADQMLELDGAVLSKAPDRAAARAILMRLRGRTHLLHSGVAIVQDGDVSWSVTQSATMQVRGFSENWLDSYLEKASPALTKSVGAYQLEGVGAQLFERIDGDYFTVLGLPLLSLLAELRRLGAVEG